MKWFNELSWNARAVIYLCGIFALMSVCSVLILEAIKPPQVGEKPSKFDALTYGYVESIGECEARRHAYICDVKFVGGHSKRLDFARFPGDKLAVGDLVFMQISHFDNRYETAWCRNERCTPAGICYSWMGCYKD